MCFPDPDILSSGCLDNRIREGITTNSDITALETRICQKGTSPLTVNIALLRMHCSKRAKKDAINAAEYLRELPGEPVVYEAKDVDERGLPLNMVQKNLLLGNRDAMPAKLFLKVGAKVVLTRNFDVKMQVV